MTKVAKKKNRKLRRQIRKTIGALLMVSAIVVAAIPVTGVNAEPTFASKPERKVWVWDNNKTEKSVAGSPASSIQAATKNTIPYVPEDSIVYTSGDGRFQFAYVDPDGGGNKYAVILNYNANALAESSLTIPDTMEAFKKYKQTSSDGYFCLVTQNDEFMFYDVYEQATDNAGVLLYRVPAVKYGDYGHEVIPSGSQNGESIIVNRNQLYYGSDGSTLVYGNTEKEMGEDGTEHEVQKDYPVEPIMVTNQKPCYYEQRSIWGDQDDTQLYYQEKKSVTPDKPNGTLIHPSSQAHYRIDAIVKYIGQQFVDAVSDTDPDTGVQYIASWEVHKGKYRENPDDGVFANNANITNLQIGSNLSGISDYAFQGCATLQSVSFGNNLQTVGNGAFANCIRLSNCDIPTNSNIQAFGKDAFYNCTALTSITIPIGLKAIGDSCFEGCTRLQTIDLCGGSELDTMLQTIGNSAFKNCSSLGSLTFPTQYAESDLQIGIFEGCSNLQFVKVPNKFMSFAETTNTGADPASDPLTFEGFKNTVPESFYFWGADTDTNDRNGRSQLHKTANDHQIAYKYFDKEVYEIVIKEENGTSSITYQVNDQNQLIKIWLEGNPVNVVIPKTIGPYGIASIGTGCFNDACSIKRVTIPETVVRIEDGAFKGSHNLETVSFDNASTIQYIGTDAFRTQVVSCGHSITNKDPELTFVGAMMNDNGEDTVPFIYAMTPENTINNQSQNKSWITCHSGFPTNIEVKYVYDFTTNTGSAQMQSYPRYELYGESQKLIDWVKALPYVDETDDAEVKLYVDKIKDAYQKYTTADPSVPPTEEQMQIVNAALNVVVPTNVDSLKPGLFSGYKADSAGEAEQIAGMTPDTKISSIVLNGVDEIEPFTFTGCSELKNVSIIKAGKIGDYAFGAVEKINSANGHVTTEQNCDALEQVTLGGNITDIGKRPFRGCTKLNTITCLGDNLSYQDGILYQTTANGKTLVECLAGRGETVGSYSVGPEELSGVSEIKAEAFMDCDHVGTVDLSDTSVVDIPEKTFYDMEDLNSVILPDTVKNIEAKSFQNSKIRVLKIPGNQAYIEKDAFKNNEGQQTILFQCVQGTTADRYAKAYDYINPEYGKVYLEHTVFFWDYPDYPDTSNKILFHKVKVRDGEDAVPPTDTPKHEGYMFSGWTDYTKISKDTDVWPRFGGSIYKVEFLDWDGTVISQTGFTNPQYVEDGKSATPPQTDPVREGYTFDGWTPDYHNVSKDLTVIAKYTDNSGDQSRHTVTFYAYEKNKMTAISVQKVNDGEAAVEPAVPTRDGYTFTGWYPDKTVFSKVTTDLTIVAAYDKNSAGAGASPSGGSSSGASASPSSTAGNNNNGNNGDNTKKYTVSVSGGSGSGSYPAGAIVALNAYDMGVGKQFDKWTTSTAGVGFANAEATSTTFTMPAANVAITATYKTGNGATSNTGGNNGGSGTSGNSSNGNSGSNGSSGSNSNRNSGTTVQVTKPGISNTNLAGATVAGSTDNFVVKVTEDQTANDLAVQALQAKFGDISRVKYLPMDISLYDSTGRTKIADTSGISVNITLPLPDDLAQYAGNNKVASTLGGTIEDLNTRFTTVDGVPCVNFTATHFSPYVIYVDTANLTAGTIDATPKTGDPIHPKWFLALGLASLSLILFFKRDRKLPKTRTA